MSATYQPRNLPAKKSAVRGAVEAAATAVTWLASAVLVTAAAVILGAVVTALLLGLGMIPASVFVWVLAAVGVVEFTLRNVVIGAVILAILGIRELHCECCDQAGADLGRMLKLLAENDALRDELAEIRFRMAGLEK